MEDKHRKRILASFPNELRFKPIRVLDIPDDYRFMELDLLRLICSAANPIINTMLELRDNNGSLGSSSLDR